MKIIKRLLAVTFAAVLVIFLSGFSNGENDAAGITKDHLCGLFDGYGKIVVTYESISVENHGGNAMMICHAKKVATPGKVYVNAGFPCGTFNGTTQLSWAHVSADGEATLKCMIKKQKN